MKNQALFSSKDKSNKLKWCLLQFLFGTLRVKEKKLLLGRVKTQMRGETKMKNVASPESVPIHLKTFLISQGKHMLGPQISFERSL